MVVELSIDVASDSAGLEATVAISKAGADGLKMGIAVDQGSHGVRRDSQPGCEAGRRDVSRCGLSYCSTVSDLAKQAHKS
jgi:hypothetical protein